MSTTVSIECGAQIATEELGRQHPAPSYWSRFEALPVVSKGCIGDLVTANKLSSPRTAWWLRMRFARSSPAHGSSMAWG